MNFYKCNICGNVIHMMNGDAARVKCCGEVMEKLSCNVVDASYEKHVPLCEVVDNKIHVKVGEIEHPMEEDHYIMWVCCCRDNKVEMVFKKPGEVVSESFDYQKGSIIYSYCNKHGLWKKEL